MDVEKECLNCGKKFNPHNLFDIKKYCCYSCGDEYRRKQKNPNDEGTVIEIEV